MTHPEELLAGYVDGTLTGEERAVVDAHLTTCETCRGQVELAARARTVLAELPEVEVPFGVTRPVMDEIAAQVARDRAAARQRGPRRARLVWAAGLAAAASLVVVVALNVVPRGGGLGPAGSPVRKAASAVPGVGGGAEAATVAAVPLEVQPHVNYDADKVRELAQDVARRATSAGPAPAPSFAPSDSTAALGCVERGSGVSPGDPSLRPVEVIEAKWEGRPAYLGVFLEVPVPGQPPDKVIVWAVAKSDCSFLSYSSQRT